MTPFSVKAVWIPITEGVFFTHDKHPASPHIRHHNGKPEILYVIHPRSEKLLSPLLEKYSTETSPHLTLSAMSLSSFRTLLLAIPTDNTNAPFCYTITKVSLDDEIAGVHRCLPTRECATSVAITDMVAQARQGKSPLPIDILDEPVAFVPNGLTAEAGAILRALPDCFTDPDTTTRIIPVFSLFCHHQHAFLDFLIQKSALNPVAFIHSRILQPLAQTVVTLLCDHNFSLEAHGQNLLLSYDTQTGDTGLIYRDLGGVNARLTLKKQKLFQQKYGTPNLFYIKTHVPDAGVALERHMCQLIAFNLTKLFIQQGYGNQHPGFCDWQTRMTEQNQLCNWTTDQQDGSHNAILTPDEFCRYGFFEQSFQRYFAEAFDGWLIQRPHAIQQKIAPLISTFYNKQEGAIQIPECSSKTEWFNSFIDCVYRRILPSLMS